MDLRKLLRWATTALRTSGIARRPDAVTIYYGSLKLHVDIPPEIEESSGESPALGAMVAPHHTIAEAPDKTPLPRPAALAGLDADIMALLRRHGGAMKGATIARRLDRDESYVRHRLGSLKKRGLIANGADGYSAVPQQEPPPT